MYLKLEAYHIRNWRMADAPAIAKYAHNRKIALNLRDAFPYPHTLQDAEAFISRALGADPATLFAIINDQTTYGFSEDTYKRVLGLE